MFMMNVLDSLPDDAFFGWWCEQSKIRESYPRETRFARNFAALEEAKQSLTNHVEAVNRSRDLRVLGCGLLLHVANTDPRESGLRIEIGTIVCREKADALATRREPVSP